MADGAPYKINGQSRATTETDFGKIIRFLEELGVDHAPYSQDRSLSLVEIRRLFDQSDAFQQADRRRAAETKTAFISDADFHRADWAPKKFNPGLLRNFQEIKRVLEDYGMTTDLNRSCPVRQARRPQEVPATQATQCDRTITISWWPEIREPVTDPQLLRLITSAIRYIEEGGHGKVDTLGEFRCNTFHFHLQAEKGEFQRFLGAPRGFTRSELMQFVLRELHAGRASMLYHTEEVTFRFDLNESHRNLVQKPDGSIDPIQGPNCARALSTDDLGLETYAQFFLAIVPDDNPLAHADHPLHPHLHPLEEAGSRRFIAWLE